MGRMERAGELLRLLSLRLVSELGIAESPAGRWQVDGVGLELDLANRDGTAVVRFFSGGDRVCVRFIEVKDERQVELLIEWIRSCTTGKNARRRAPLPG
jgi:hypothetical protein